MKSHEWNTRGNLVFTSVVHSASQISSPVRGLPPCVSTPDRKMMWVNSLEFVVFPGIQVVRLIWQSVLWVIRHEYFLNRKTLLNDSGWQSVIISPFLWNDIKKWVEMSVRLLTFLNSLLFLLYYWADYFDISQDNTNMDSHNPSVPDFSISGHVNQTWDQRVLINLLHSHWPDYFQTLYDDTMILVRIIPSA